MAEQGIPGPPLRGAVDLSTLATPKGNTEAAASDPSALVVEVTEQGFEELVQRSSTVPVLINMSSAAAPASADLTSRLEALVAEYKGQWVLGNCDIDAQQGIAQAFQIQAVPAVVALIGGRPAPLFQGNASDEQIREILTQVLEVARQSGMTGAPQDDAPADGNAEPEPEPLPPLHQEAYDAIERDDLDGAIAAYDQALRENPKDADARAGRAQISLMKRTLTLDLAQARADAADRPSDVDAQLAVADLDVAGGKVEDAFVRLIDVVRTTQGDERERVRDRLVELFDVVGGEDPRVLQARQALASALY